MNIKSEIQLFADDIILLYKVIAMSNGHHILQNVLISLTKWANNWLIEFTIPKCNINK